MAQRFNMRWKTDGPLIRVDVNIFTQPKLSTYKDTNMWIQKILLEEKYGKISS